MFGMFGGGERRKSRRAQTRLGEERIGLDREMFDFQRQQAQRGQEQGQRLGDESFREYMSLFEQPSQSLSGMQDLIQRQGTQAQGLADRQAQTRLAQGGVRGPAAALERQRQSGMLTQNLLDNLLGVQMQDENQRRAAQAKLVGERALLGQGRALS